MEVWRNHNTTAPTQLLLYLYYIYINIGGFYGEPPSKTLIRDSDFTPILIIISLSLPYKNKNKIEMRERDIVITEREEAKGLVRRTGCEWRRASRGHRRLLTAALGGTRRSSRAGDWGLTSSSFSISYQDEALHRHWHTPSRVSPIDVANVKFNYICAKIWTSTNHSPNCICIREIKATFSEPNRENFACSPPYFSFYLFLVSHI